MNVFSHSETTKFDYIAGGKNVRECGSAEKSKALVKISSKKKASVSVMFWLKMQSMTRHSSF